MNGPDNQAQESSVFGNGISSLRSLPTSATSSEKFVDVDEVGSEQGFADPPVIQIERDLDELTYSGTAINDLEIQLTRTKKFYQQVLLDGKLHVDMLRKKLHSHIVKSEPFIEVWRKARQIQDMSNQAAARYDKANSQHTAAKEMIRVAESQLEACRAEQEAFEKEPASPSPLDLAWQEMLNHATTKVVLTEKERRDSEMEHRAVLEECKRVMDEYRTTEQKLRSHVVKSRPYFQERYRVNQQLGKLREKMKNLEQKINESKRSYSASLKRLEVLNTEMHEKRSSKSLNPNKISSYASSPEMRRGKMRADDDDVASLNSFQITGDYSGSTGSLPSIGVLSNSETSDSDTRSLENLSSRASPPNPSYLNTTDDCPSEERLSHVASGLVVQCLATAVSRLNSNTALT